jgi:membrane-bound serine protease (ClpP class)
MVENILLNPNLAYLFLVGGFSLALLAILTPGTGVLEIGAFFCLILAGFAVYQLPINYWALVILLIGVFPFIWAVRKSGRLIYLGIAILALVIGSAYLFEGEVWWQPAVNPILAAIVSILVGGFFWIAASKTIEASAAVPSHDLSGIIGATGEAKSEIHIEGTVQVWGELWTATSEEKITEGSMVRVIGREGFILKVIKMDETSEL